MEERDTPTEDELDDAARSLIPVLNRMADKHLHEGYAMPFPGNTERRLFPLYEEVSLLEAWEILRRERRGF